MAPSPPQQPPSFGDGFSKAGDWLSNNWVWLAAAFALVIVLVILLKALKANASTKKLQRDGLERLRKSLVASCLATRGPAKSIWIGGSPRDPPARLGKYRGHCRTLEATWFAYKPPSLNPFARLEIIAVNPVDIATGLDVKEIQLRALGIHFTRDLAFAIPDAHDPQERAKWARASGRLAANAREFTEDWKFYCARVIDNALAFNDSMNAAEDRSYLRQEVTRSENELTETLQVPAAPPASNDAAGAPKP